MSALRQQNMKNLQEKWLNMVTSCLPYFGENLKQISISVIHQICNNIEDIGECFLFLKDARKKFSPLFQLQATETGKRTESFLRIMQLPSLSLSQFCATTACWILVRQWIRRTYRKYQVQHLCLIPVKYSIISSTLSSLRRPRMVFLLSSRMPIITRMPERPYLATCQELFPGEANVYICFH